MTFKSSEHMVVVKKEDKEAKLRSLLLEALSTVSSDVREPVLRLLAKSTSSPVVAAVVGLQMELAAIGVEVRIVLAAYDQPSNVLNGLNGRVRHLADVRCHDAHELMVLGQNHAWIGDCMRRDPAARDSFELHSSTCVARASSVALSFDRLWALAVPVAGPTLPAHAAALELAADLAGLPVDTSSAPQVLTRH
jgi:hypothetical protein